MVPAANARRNNSRLSHAEYFRAIWPAFEAGKSVTAPGKLIISGDDAVIFADFTGLHLHRSQHRARFQTPVTMHLTVTTVKS